MVDQKAKRKCEVGGGHEYHSSVQVTAIVGNLRYCVCAECHKMWAESRQDEEESK